MNYNGRYKELNNNFNIGKDFYIRETNIDVCFINFNSYSSSTEDKFLTSDRNINENSSFLYPVFVPSGRRKKDNDEVIILLHGLNERNWEKYLTWAEFMSYNSGKPVILFPIAFHINRAPLSWSNPRKMVNLLNTRKEKFIQDRSMSIANVALSNRLSQNPERFYLSGRQTWDDLTTLFDEIKTGKHPYFKEGAGIDIFAYSIGAFLSQIALMSNQKGLYTNTRLFMFCGGSIFNSMQGASRSIMDNLAFDTIRNYYINIFGNEATTSPVKWIRDKAFSAFSSMISVERFKEEREEIFTKLAGHIKGITLTKDRVIPHEGVTEAMGAKNTESNIRNIDFPFPYTHENPFPANTKDTTSLNKTFNNVFSEAVEFLI